jgi:hypothetical protein
VINAFNEDYPLKRLRELREGKRAKRIEIGRIRKTTGIIMEISDFPAEVRILTRS